MAESVSTTTCDCQTCLADGAARGRKSVELVAADRWKFFRATDGSLSYGVPSSKPDRFYRTSADGCTCPDQNYRPWLLCKHIIAVRLYEEAVKQGVLA
jgi:hypothetical protein